MTIDLSSVKQTIPAISKHLIEIFGSITNSLPHVFDNYQELFCPYCGGVLENQGSIRFDCNRTLYLKPPIKKACLKPECMSSSLSVGSIEYRVKILGQNEDDIRTSYSNRIMKGVATKRDAGFFDDKSNNPYSKEYWIKNGLSEEEAQQELKNKANKMIQTKRDAGFFDDKSNNPYSKEYWIKNGLSEEEAQLKIKTKNHNCPEYWVERGYSCEDAKVRATASASTNSMSEIVKRHGLESAEALYKKRRKLMSDSWSESSTRHQNFGTSKAATSFFTELSKRLREEHLSENVIFKHQDNKTEWYLHGDKIYFYDCCVKEIKLLIEFNGEHVHPRRDRLSDEQWSKWRHAFTKETADEIETKDFIKMRTASKFGYKVVYVWSKDDKIDRDTQINNLLTIIRNEYEHQRTQQ